jgi:hypothetical protein
VADATVAVDCLEALEIGLEVAAEISFDQNLAGIDGLNDLIELFRRKIFGADIWVDAGNFQNFFGVFGPDAVNVGQGGFDAFVTGNIYSEKAWHNEVGVVGMKIGEGRGILTLLLFVAGIFANHANDVIPPHDFAALTESFDGCSDFHGFLLCLS